MGGGRGGGVIGGCVEGEGEDGAEGVLLMGAEWGGGGIMACNPSSHTPSRGR